MWFPRVDNTLNTVFFCFHAGKPVETSRLRMSLENKGFPQINRKETTRKPQGFLWKYKENDWKTRVTLSPKNFNSNDCKKEGFLKVTTRTLHENCKLSDVSFNFLVFFNGNPTGNVD